LKNRDDLFCLVNLLRPAFSWNDLICMKKIFEGWIKESYETLRRNFHFQVMTHVLSWPKVIVDGDTVLHDSNAFDALPSPPLLAIYIDSSNKPIWGKKFGSETRAAARFAQLDALVRVLPLSACFRP
jgi:hypothetical protein